MSSKQWNVMLKTIIYSCRFHVHIENATILDFMYQTPLDGEHWALSTIKETKEHTNIQDEIGILSLSHEQLAAFNTDWEKALSDEEK